MYAITEKSFRAISSPADVGDGETAVESLPDALLDALAACEARQQRDRMLRLSDWTQVGDAPLTPDHRAAWSAYREALRDIPSQADFPASIDWPAIPAEG